ncbi:MAG: hypothetical protein IAG10_06735 [Planctomycetaceae bacterium]|nr:hypothetical protein [Planctomycetaceae bacterium]
MHTNRILLGLFLLLVRVASADEPAPPRADLEIRRAAGSSAIQIRTTSRLAGAVHSLTWNGQEFINSTDHGRQLQSSSSFSSDGKHWAEAFNPTEAGSRDDGAGPNSTSRLLHSVATDDALQTTTQMAFWLSPGQKSEEHPAINTTKLSNHLLTKRLRIGLPDLPHAIRYDVTFTVPLGERHTFAQFEALTGYMPEEFRSFWTFRPQTGELQPISFGPGEQPYPIVLSTESGSHAMGIYSPQQPSSGFENVGYGRWRFERERVVKWNTVFRQHDADGIEPGEFSFRNFVIIGDRETVRTSLVELHRQFPPQQGSVSGALKAE